MKDMDDIPTALRAMEGHVPPQLSQLAADEFERLRAVVLNIQALAERGLPIDTKKLATRCRRALEQSTRDA